MGGILAVYEPINFEYRPLGQIRLLGISCRVSNMTLWVLSRCSLPLLFDGFKP